MTTALSSVLLVCVLVRLLLLNFGEKSLNEFRLTIFLALAVPFMDLKNKPIRIISHVVYGFQILIILYLLVEFVHHHS